MHRFSDRNNAFHSAHVRQVSSKNVQYNVTVAQKSIKIQTHSHCFVQKIMLVKAVSHFCHLTRKFCTFSTLTNDYRNVFGSMNYNSDKF